MSKQEERAELGNKLLENVLSMLPVAVYTCDYRGRITYFNQRAAEIWGQRPKPEDDEQTFCGSLRLLPVDGSPGGLDDAPAAKTLKSGMPARDLEAVLERQDGSRVVISVNIEPLFDERGELTGAINAFQDITPRKQIETDLQRTKGELAALNRQLEQRVQERSAASERARTAVLREMEEQKKLEEQLRQTQKLESVGILAGGVAHDFNNILNIILGYALLIGRYAPGNQAVADALKVIEEEVDRGAALVRHLLTVARKTNAQLTTTDVNEALAQLRNLLNEIFPKTIEVSLDLDPGVPVLFADANQVNQALLNICVNARDAMPAGGQLILRSRLERDNLPEECGPRKAEYYVYLEVSDTGEGIEPSVRSRIFEPFYTTKEVGQGTGLGLAMVHSIMQNHDGFVTVDSEKGRGASFRLYFPVVSQPHESDFLQGAQEEPAQATAAKGLVSRV
jgi:signal transduction histidine kinase